MSEGSADAPTRSVADLTAVLAPALALAAGEGGRAVTPLSFMLDLAAPSPAAEPLAVSARVERATRTLVFTAAEARTGGGALAGAASAVFRVL